MKKKITSGVMLSAMLFLSACGIFPKEEELEKTPIVEAYQKEDFKMASVERGDLQLYEKIDCVCMTLSEEQLYFKYGDMNYKGIYVKTGDTVIKGQVLAELYSSGKESQIKSTDDLVLKAPIDGVITYAKEIEEQEKSLAGGVVIIMNNGKAAVLNAYTVNWNRFEPGQEYVMRIKGEDRVVTVINPEDVGLAPAETPKEGEKGAVYFQMKDPSVFITGGEIGRITFLVEEKKDVLYVPNSAITTINDKEIVYVEDADGIRDVKYIETGLVTESKTEIISGLSEGDKVILE